jgi:hypothetical protein
MRPGSRRVLALTAVAGLVLVGCGAEQEADAPAPTDQASDIAEGDRTDAPEDPNDDIEDGRYRGNGVVLPVPEGWSLDPMAFSQGLVAAVSGDGTQQMTAQAIDTEQAQAAGQPMELDVLLDGIRQQIGQDADVDEEIRVDGAERAHQLTYLELPPQQEGAPEVSVTLVLAEDGQGLVGEFVYSAATESYDSDTASLLVADAGFDPDSEPPAMPPPPPAP